MTPNAWLKATVVKKVEISFPDGRPLYAYRCTPALLEKAHNVLNDGYKAAYGQMHIDPAYGALFCLYAAEWWRQNYETGHWAWRGIYDSLGWPELSASELQELVSNGLKWWKRSVLHAQNGNRLFLVTVACEGGLPLKLLRRESSYLKSYFRDILLARESLSVHFKSTRTLAEEADDRLPKSLQHATVHELGAQLVDSVVEARLKIGHITDYPLEELSKLDPDWKDKFPLSVSDGVAEELLSGLLTARLTIKNDTASPIEIKRQLTKVDAQLWIKRLEVNVSDSISLEFLKVNCPDFDFSTCSSRLDLRIYIADKVHRLALLIRRNNNWLVRRTSSGSFIVRDEDAGAEVNFGLFEGSKEISRWEQLGSQGPSENSPSVYKAVVGDISHETRHLEFVDTGSVSVNSGSVAVLVNEEISNWSTVTDGAESGVKDQSACFSLGLVRGSRSIVLAINKPLAIEVVDDKFLIQPSASGHAADNYCWNGTRRYWDMNRFPVFHGIPHLMSVDTEGVNSPVPLSEIECRPASIRGSGGWIDLSDEHAIGDLVVRLRDGGITLWRSRVVVIPNEANFRIVPEKDCGSLVFERFSCVDIGVKSPLVEMLSKENSGERYTITLRTLSTDASHAEVNLSWQGGARATLRCPVPHTTAWFLDKSKKPVAFGSAVAIDEMLGLQVHYLSPTNENTHIEMEFSATDVNPAVIKSTSKRLPMVQSSSGLRTYELGPLVGEIRRLFVMSLELDCRVRFTIQPGPLNQFIEIKRYEHKLFVDHESSVVQIRKSFQAQAESAPTQITVVATSLRQPEKSMELSREGNDWHLTELGAELAPWLLVALDSGRVVGRPAVLPVKTDALSTDLKALEVDTKIEEDEGATQKLIERVICEPHYETRKNNMRNTLSSMGKEPDNSLWIYLEECLRNFSTYPPSSVDFYTRLSEDPSALVMGLCRLHGEARERLWSLHEEMAFDWLLIPPAIWGDTSRIFRSYLQQTLIGIDPDLIEKQAANVSQYVLERIPSLDMMFGVLQNEHKIRSEDGVAETSASLMHLEYMIQPRFEELKQDLLTEHAGNEFWPDTELELAWTDLSVQRLADSFPAWSSVDSALGFQQAVLKAPLLASFVLASGQYPQIEDRSYFLVLREFDQVWFDEVLGLSLPWAYLHFSQENP